MQARLRSTTLAIALGFLATGAYAMTPLEQSGRGYHENERAAAGSFDKAGNDVKSRAFDGTQQLESSGRGSALDKIGSSAANESTSDVNASRDTSPWASGYDSTGYQQGSSSSWSISEQAAANQTAYDWPVMSEVAGSGYTTDGDLNTSAEQSELMQGDKLVVIVPEGWDGSVPELVAALDQSSDEPTIVIMNGEASGPAVMEANPSNLM